ncbi:GNAT family N-acetyltransferase [Pelagovum pacificum]|uniref:GNAT family N-acetyltransferase n=1 Tax=Pelagovum pacificum TaxID=2588711 RepID=A0A5C5GID0_9RHOB|nr:GNAT family N-acetyltransferase [Pelagovum pacificum]QQA43219.1 GNAT family N-acetyltransferase [Pelagovum pacificum]TNY33641.1 GNAT family N-acetyltransferase [Pelagovum pacificum]
MIVRKGFHPDDRPVLARLYWQAFGGKLGRVLGPEQKALRFIEEMASPSHALCAYDGEVLIGVAGFHTRDGALVGGDFADLRRVYGLPGALWRAACLRLLERPMEQRQLLVDGIFVTEAERGRGVGTALIEALAREAQARHCREVLLDVVEDNVSARALYDRRGFQEVGERGSPLIRLLFGYGKATTMARRIM